MADWIIEKLVPGGSGMARLPDGRVGFAPGALPGEHIAVEAQREHKSHVEAQRFRLLVASEQRVQPPCPVSAECGGCDWMALSLEAQRAHKVGILEQALRRTGGLRDLPPLTLLGAGPDLGYRNRLRFQIDEQGEVGFFERGSRRLVVIPRCAVAEADLDVALATLRDAGRAHAAALARFASAEIRVATDAPRYGLRLEPRPNVDLSGAPVQRLLAELRRSFSVVVGDAANAPEQRYALPEGVSMHVPVGAFTQVNWAVNRLLVEAVVQGARERKIGSFCDLYAGTGNFTLPLLATGSAGVAVEGYTPSVRAAQRAAQEQGLGGEFIAEDVRHAARRLVRAGRRFDLVVLDPPRTGARDVLDALSSLAASAVAYVACDPVTLARDLKWLLAHGFELHAVTAYDMFPHTHHFETLAWLRRRAG